MAYLTQSLHRLVQRAPHALATVDGDRRRDWAMVERDVRRFAGALQRSGVQPGDRVALLSRNADHYIDYVLGTVWAGGVINPINTRWSAAEIAYSLEDCGTRILIVEDIFIPLIRSIRAAAPGLRLIVQIGLAPLEEGAVGYDDWIRTPLTLARRTGPPATIRAWAGRGWPPFYTPAARPAGPRE